MPSRDNPRAGGQPILSRHIDSTDPHPDAGLVRAITSPRPLRIFGPQSTVPEVDTTYTDPTMMWPGDILIYEVVEEI